MRSLPLFNQLVHGFTSSRIPNGVLGAGIDIDVPINQIWSPISFSFIVNCSAAVANRYLVVTIGDTPNYGFYYWGSNSITAGQSRTFNLFQGANLETPALATASWQIPIPLNCFVQYPFHIGVGCLNFDVNDQITNINIIARTWIL